MEERYRRKPTILTTNLEYDEWHQLSGNLCVVGPGAEFRGKRVLRNGRVWEDDLTCSLGEFGDSSAVGLEGSFAGP